MKQLLYGIRYLWKNKGSNFIKVISLTLGLVVGLVLFSQVAFDMSYDNFYPDKDRIYSVTIKWNVDGRDLDEARTINAPFTPTMVQEFPEVESGTVMTNGAGDVEYVFDGKKIAGKQLIADSLFFQTFGLPIVAGNVTDMGKPFHVFVSETFARRAFGDDNPLGKRLVEGEHVATVAGVFKDIPKNSHLELDLVISFNTMYERGMSRDNWRGMGSFNGYVKLREGIDPKVVEAKIPDMMRRHYDVDAELREGISRQLFLRPVVDIHTKDPEVRRTALILSLLAFALLFASAMNYVLLSVSSLPKRAKSIGVYKCNGASDKSIFSMFMTETAVLVFISLLLAVLIIFAFRGYIGVLIKADLSAVFAPANLWASGVVLLLLFFTTGVLPSRVFSSIPVTQVFRSYADSKRKWKNGLLFVQFVGISFMLSLLVIIMMQYHMILNKNMGYDTAEVLKSSSLGDMSIEQKERAKAELLRFPNVESVTLTTQTPLNRLGRSPVVNTLTKESLFIGHYLLADADFAKAFNIPFVAGRSFRESASGNVREVFVNETLVRMAGLDDPVGKQIDYLDRTWTICGVMKDYQSGTVYNAIFPVVVLPLDTYDWEPDIVVRLTTVPTKEVIASLSTELKRYSNNEESLFLSFKEEYTNYYRDARLFRDSVIVASMIMLIISILGLFGFVEDEITRRTKEIAIRKVNGAVVLDVLQLFAKGISFIVLPAIVIGLLISFAVGSEWLQHFVLKIPLHFTLFLLSGLAIFMVTQFCVVARSVPVAMSNPVNYLKAE
ncbi:ABC transporter permease [Parabacteroides sp. PF5-9]|uniref:ABC transporter permease n=1 Tax=Parabacteroides sp. PF5-9 TaxID=1742404 RepID=UPI002474DA4F|nr:ABC transporter permease [Parabacteroides sp. PF5-9]MDH6357316.1 putative ABC transport system permease protein [Parabacteroides sp. PF5-9]